MKSTSLPAAVSRPAFLLAAAACGAVALNVLSGGAPASAGTGHEVSVASRLALTASASAPSIDSLGRLQDLSASRSQRSEQPGPAALASAAGDTKTLQVLAQAADAQAELLAQRKAAAAAKAAAEAAAKAAAKAAAAAKAKAAAATPASFQDYALRKLGGNRSQFGCLQNLWGKESDWNPDAHNPASTAYGIPQLLDSTWAGTGIAKTSDGFRQIDAGLVYIDRAYGSPCGAWSHSRAYNWY
jgi:hypothetical protein